MGSESDRRKRERKPDATIKRYISMRKATASEAREGGL
jgi:hypothetical protein